MSTSILLLHQTKATTDTASSGDGVQHIIDGLRRRTHYALSMQRRRRKDLVKLKSLWNYTDIEIWRIHKYISEQMVEELDIQTSRHALPQAWAPLASTAASCSDLRSKDSTSSCTSSHTSSFSTTTNLASKSALESLRNDHLKRGGCPYLKSLHSQDIKWDLLDDIAGTRTEMPSYYDNLFEALVADIAADGHRGRGRDHLKKAARNWLELVASMQ